MWLCPCDAGMQLQEGVPPGRQRRARQRRTRSSWVQQGGSPPGFVGEEEEDAELQIDWRRRGWSHGIGEWAWLDCWSRAPPRMIPGAGGLHHLSLPLSFPLSFRIRSGKSRRADSRSFFLRTCLSRRSVFTRALSPNHRAAPALLKIDA